MTKLIDIKVKINQIEYEGQIEVNKKTGSVRNHFNYGQVEVTDLPAVTKEVNAIIDQHADEKTRYKTFYPTKNVTYSTIKPIRYPVINKKATSYLYYLVIKQQALIISKAQQKAKQI